jgi:hypothetical protein
MSAQQLRPVAVMVAMAEEPPKVMVRMACSRAAAAVARDARAAQRAMVDRVRMAWSS